MWRFWNNIPRILRQQLHGPRGCQAGVCVEEDKPELSVDIVCANHGKNELETASSRVQGSCGQGPESNKEGGAGTHQEENDWHRRYCHANFWSKFCGFQQCTLDAVKWGTAVVLGLQLSRNPNVGSYPEIIKDPDKWQPWQGLFFRVAFAMPPDSFGVKQTIFDQPASKGVDKLEKWSEKKASDAQRADKLQNDGKTLNDAIQDFMRSCQQYAARGSNVSGLYDMEAGNLTRAVENLQLATELGHAPAFFNLALCYEMGTGVKRDLFKAATYYSKAADMGHAQSIFNLALITLKGEGGVDKDIAKGIELMNKAAEHGVAQAHTYLGVYYTENDHSQQDFERAVSYFSAAASQDDAEGQYFLGLCFENGWGVENSDEEAGKLYSAAAQAGHDGALYNLAAFHEYGLGGFDCDLEVALSMYEKSAAKGNESAKFKLKEMEAREAVNQWMESQRIASSQSVPTLTAPGLRRNPHGSSPALTDHVYKNVASFWSGGLHAWSSWQTLTSGATLDNDGKVFSVGEPVCETTQTYAFPEQRLAHTCVMAMHRTPTLPDLSVALVQ